MTAPWHGAPSSLGGRRKRLTEATRAHMGVMCRASIHQEVAKPQVVCMRMLNAQQEKTGRFPDLSLANRALCNRDGGAGCLAILRIFKRDALIHQASKNSTAGVECRPSQRITDYRPSDGSLTRRFKNFPNPTRPPATARATLLRRVRAATADSATDVSRFQHTARSSLPAREKYRCVFRITGHRS